MGVLGITWSCLGGGEHWVCFGAYVLFFYSISRLPVAYCKRNFQPKLQVLLLDITMLQPPDIPMTGRFVFCSLKQMLKEYFHKTNCSGV